MIMRESYIGSNIVEIELATGRAANVDAASNRNGLGLVGLAILEVLELVLKVPNVVGDVVLCGC